MTLIGFQKFIGKLLILFLKAVLKDTYFLQEYCFWPKQGRAYMTQNKDPISQFVVWGFLFILKQNNH